jgi:hypothetical protein
MTKNVSALMKALHQSINEAILESNDVAAAMAALKCTGNSPVFSIDVALEEASELHAEPVVPLGHAEELVLSDADVEFLGALGITDPSWSSIPTKSGTA